MRLRHGFLKMPIPMVCCVVRWPDPLGSRVGDARYAVFLVRRKGWGELGVQKGRNQETGRDSERGEVMMMQVAHGFFLGKRKLRAQIRMSGSAQAHTVLALLSVDCDVPPRRLWAAAIFLIFLTFLRTLSRSLSLACALSLLYLLSVLAGPCPLGPGSSLSSLHHHPLAGRETDAEICSAVVRVAW